MYKLKILVKVFPDMVILFLTHVCKKVDIFQELQIFKR